MRLGISSRLFLAIVATSVLTVGLVIAATRWNFERGFLGYLNEIAVDRMDAALPRLAQAYVQHGGWAFLNDANRLWFKILRGTDGPASPSDSSGVSTVEPTGSLSRLALLDANLRWVAGYQGVTLDMERRPVVVDENVVGWLALAPFQSVSDGGDQRFAQGQLQTTIAVAIVSVLLSAGIAWWVARRLLRPVKQVAAATHRLAAGEREVRVQVGRGRDEVAQLARDFNRLAQTLERNAGLRHAFLADISHELRTPLAVLRGELEALADGIRPINAAAIESLQVEVAQLGKLVDDLNELALSDEGALSYRMESVDLNTLLARAVSTHRLAFSSAGLQCNLRTPGDPACVRGDAGRLQQLFDNLLENSRRYTDSLGEVRLTLERRGQGWSIDLEDSKPGLAPEHLDQMFERLFRGESSRNRASGGAGLGLAIARNIVSAHGGEITARSSALGGVWISILLPLEDAVFEASRNS